MIPFTDHLYLLFTLPLPSGSLYLTHLYTITGSLVLPNLPTGNPHVSKGLFESENIYFYTCDGWKCGVSFDGLNQWNYWMLFYRILSIYGTYT